MSNTKITNPFRPTRWEHHSGGAPLIWFTPTAELLSEDKSTYVHGSRGSGKTTLLRSICWEDLLQNHSLTLQKSLTDFKHIGVYIRLPDHVAASLGNNNWESLFPDAPDWTLEYVRFFSLAVELICVEKTLSAAHTLRLENKVELDATQELLLVSTVIEEFPPLKNFSEHTPKTFLDLSRVCRQIVRAMNEASGRGSLLQTVETLPSREPAEFLTFVVAKLSGIIRLKKASGNVSPGFKFCLDDCEVLTGIQTKTINTLVRKSRFPISWVICSVGESIDLYDTFIPKQPLTDADRRVISLDDRAPKEFFDLCQAVSSLRIYYTISKENRPPTSQYNISSFFSLNERLGVSTVNSIIAQMISRSTSSLSLKVQEAAFLLRSELHKKAKKYAGKYPEGSSSIPYYEAYLLWHWDGREDSFTRAADDAEMDRIRKNARLINRSSFQAWMRRKMVAAMLQIASRLGFRRLPLSGANVIVSLADGSIRDFLEIMGEIFDRFESSRMSADTKIATAERFAFSRTKVSLKAQADGIYASSEAFFKGISIHTDARPDAVYKLVEGLGELTQVLQSAPNDPSVLSSAERGVFVVDEIQGEGLDDDSFAMATFYRAELAGYLRTSTVARKTVSDENSIKNKLVGYRLHRRFSPFFHFSYRGAYEVVHLTESSLDKLLFSQHEVSPSEWARTQAVRVANDMPNQLSLFDSKSLSDE